MNARLDKAAIAGMLRQRVRLAGSEAAWASAQRVPVRSVGMFLAGLRDPTPAILNALGIERYQPPAEYRFVAGRSRNVG